MLYNDNGENRLEARVDQMKRSDDSIAEQTLGWTQQGLGKRASKET